MRVAELAAFIKAREAVRLHKEAGKPLRRADPIIAKYRFCNVIRADDRVTKFVFQWAERYAGDPDLWFAFVVARLFNNPSTLNAIAKFVLPFKPAAVQKELARRKMNGHNIFNAAYIVSTNGMRMEKVEYLMVHVLQPLWKARRHVRPWITMDKGYEAVEPLESFHAKLQQHQGMGSFMAAQVVADMKYFPPWYSPDLALPVVPDWWTFAASGPGSRRGLNRVMGNPTDAPWQEAAWRGTLSNLHRELLPKLPAAIGTRLSAQDLQNCLCELDKYERARLGEGTPKQLYKPFVS